MKKPGRSVVLYFASVVAIMVGIILSAYLLSRFMVKVQHTKENTITVKGVAEKTVRSDVASFYCTITVPAQSVQEGYAALMKAKAVLCGKLDSLGFPAAVREDEEINRYERYRTIKRTENGKTVSEEVFDHYNFEYRVRVRTKEVETAAANALKIYDLSAQQWDVTITKPEFYLSDPEQYKLELVDAASQAATDRAHTVAEKCGSTLGQLITARQGVIQITRPASSETSDYGIYDTSSLEKNMRLVMTLDFSLR